MIGGGAVLAVPSGETRKLSSREARDIVASGEVLVCHALFVSARLGTRPLQPMFDVLELFAFARPGEPCLPSPLGLARALKLSEPRTAEESAPALHRAAGVLLDGLLALSRDEKERARKTAAAMAKAGWRWGPAVLSVLGEPERMVSPLSGFDAWRGLNEWEDSAPRAALANSPLKRKRRKRGCMGWCAPMAAFAGSSVSLHPPR